MRWFSNFFNFGSGAASSLPVFTFTETQIMAPVRHIMPTVPTGTDQSLREIKRAWTTVARDLEKTPSMYSEVMPGVTSASISLETLANSFSREGDGKISALKKLWETSMQYTHGIEASIAGYANLERTLPRAMIYDLDAFRDKREIRRAQAPGTSDHLQIFLTKMKELNQIAHAPANEASDQLLYIPGRPHFLR